MKDAEGNAVPQWKLKPVVKPDGWCTLPSGRRKLAFNTEEKARKALAHAQHNREAQGLDHVENRVYDDCNGVPDPMVDAHHYHLTAVSLERYRDEDGGEIDAEEDQ